MQKTHFIKYNNAVSIAIAVLLLATGGAMAASPDARGLLYNTEDIPRSVDNSYLLHMDIERADFGLVILEVEEDDQGYYIKYHYNTVKVAEYSWQPVSQEGTLTVLKSALGKQDLGELVARELGQLIDREYTYAKDAQKIERDKGPSKKVITTKYAGLIGALLDPKDKVFPGYEPIVKAPEIVQEQGADMVTAGSVTATTENLESGILTLESTTTPSQIQQNEQGFPPDTGETNPGIIYPQISADYDDYLENTASNRESATTTEVSSATTMDSNVENATSTESVVESSTTTESTTSVTSTESIEANSTTTDVGGSATSTGI